MYPRYFVRFFRQTCHYTFVSYISYHYICQAWSSTRESRSREADLAWGALPVAPVLVQVSSRAQGLPAPRVLRSNGRPSGGPPSLHLRARLCLLVRRQTVLPREERPGVRVPTGLVPAAVGVVPPAVGHHGDRVLVVWNHPHPGDIIALYVYPAATTRSHVVMIVGIGLIGFFVSSDCPRSSSRVRFVLER